MSVRSFFTLRLKDNRVTSLWGAISPPLEHPVVREELLAILRRFANRSPKAFSSSNLGTLHAFSEHDGSASNPVFALSEASVDSPTLTTSNVMGVVKLKGETLELTVEIGSRFDSGESQHFLNYLLHRVFAGSFTDPIDLSPASLWDLLLILLFRIRLVEALAQGLFKTYTRFEHNGPQFRGTLDINRHLRVNVPFIGNLAHTTHEFSHDTPVARLIRSTLWHVRCMYPRLLDSSTEPVMEAIQAIERNTPSWDVQHVSLYIKQNSRPLRHPYYTGYEPLRTLCLAVLQEEGAALYQSEDEDDVEGVLFDGAWLWEQYLAALLVPLGMKHCVYDKGNGIGVFQGSGYAFYPDFYHKVFNVVLDAKYKRGPAREDLHQVLAYMYLLGATNGGVILPPDGSEATTIRVLATKHGVPEPRSFWKQESESLWHEIVFRRPTESLHPAEFIRDMQAAEAALSMEVQACWKAAA